TNLIGHKATTHNRAFEERDLVLPLPYDETLQNPRLNDPTEYPENKEKERGMRGMNYHRTGFLRRPGMLLICALSLTMPAIAQSAGEAGEEPGIYPDSTVIRFFQRTSGWIASDGALSVPLSDCRTLWLMGDSHIDDYDSVS